MTETKTTPTTDRQVYVESAIREWLSIEDHIDPITNNPSVKQHRVIMSDNGFILTIRRNGYGGLSAVQIRNMLLEIDMVADVEVTANSRWEFEFVVTEQMSDDSTAARTEQLFDDSRLEQQKAAIAEATEAAFDHVANQDDGEYVEDTDISHTLQLARERAENAVLDELAHNDHVANQNDGEWVEKCVECGKNSLEAEMIQEKAGYICGECYDKITDRDTTNANAPFEGAEQCSECDGWFDPLDIIDGNCDACILKDIRPATDDSKTTEPTGGEANDPYPCDRCGTSTDERFADEKYGEVCETCSTLGKPEPLTEPTISDESFDREKMLSRLEKLLALANGEGTTEAERNLAMERASSLMTKYRIDETMIRLATDEEAPMTHLYVQIGLFWEQKAWKLALVPAVARLCFCTGWMCKGNEFALFVGEQDAISTAEVMINGLMAQLKAAYAHDAKVYEGAKDVDGMIWKKDYLVSASRRIAERVRHIEDERKVDVTNEVEQQMFHQDSDTTPTQVERAVSLIVVDADQQKAATEYVADKFGFTTSRTNGTMIKSADAAALGRAAGDKATFTKGVSASSNKQLNS